MDILEELNENDHYTIYEISYIRKIIKKDNICNNLKITNNNFRKFYKFFRYIQIIKKHQNFTLYPYFLDFSICDIIFEQW